ncbi:radical activating enzyme, partial [mine drainage metagenome]
AASTAIRRTRFTAGSGGTIEAVLARVQALGSRYVCVTGGEPLAQPGCPELLLRLCDAGLRVSIETSGAMSLAEVDARVVRVVDVKTPGSGEESRNRYEELARLEAKDQVKFVICDRADYEWSAAKVRELALQERCGVLFSPSHAQLAAPELAEWILADRLPVRFQIQLHKVLWGNVPGR